MRLLSPSKRSRIVLGLFALLLLAAAWGGVWKLRSSRRGPALPPAAASFRIYLLGGSVALGDPYWPKADLGKIVSLWFGGEIRGRRIEVVNLGGRGKGAAGALQDAERIARSKAEPGTAVALLYLGNNEFLRFDKRHDLRKKERDLIDEAVVTPREVQQVLEQYGAAMERIVHELRGARVPVVFSSVAVNMQDWEPNRSALADPDHEARVRALWAEAERRTAAGDATHALESCLGILALEPCFAIACKRAGDCYRELGRFDLARAQYQRAVDCDGNSLRETSQQDSIRREVCKRNGVPLVDAVGILEAASQDHLVGWDLLWDNCHPTLDGYLRIAGGFVEELEPLLGVRRARVRLEVADVEQALGIDSTFVRGVYHSRGQYCYTASTLTWNPRPRLERAHFYLARAAGMGAEDADITCSQAVLAALEGDMPGSLIRWKRAFDLDRGTTLVRVKNPYVVQLMERNGVKDLAARLR